MSEDLAIDDRPQPEEKSADETSKKRSMPRKICYEHKFTAPLRKKRKNQYNPAEEARLERIVFGDYSDVVSKLPGDEPWSTSSKYEITLKEDIIEDKDESDSDVQDVDDSELRDAKKAAWTDDDEDEKFSVEDALKAQSYSLPTGRPEKLYTEYLGNKYKQLVGTPKWAELKKPDDEADDLDNEILKHSCHLEQPRGKNLPKNIIEIKAVTPINKETHNEGPVVSSLEFHPTSTVALVAGTSGILSLFQVDGIENNKLHSMQYKRFPISKAKFLRDGTEVLVGSQYHAHCHAYNLLSGKTYRIPLPHGMTNMKHYEVSPDGKLLAVCGRLGEIYLLTSASKEYVATLKMNGRCRALAFTPDSKTLITHGDSNEMYVWDVNSRACVHRAVDDGCLSCASVALSASGQFLATGSREGVVNLYDTKTVLQSQHPVPLKVVLNLVTSISALKFNPQSEILAMASDKKHNAFKMLHLPSFNVFSNFPTFQTKMSMPEAIDFSPGSGFLGVSNRSGSAFLYRLKHYGNY